MRAEPHDPNTSLESPFQWQLNFIMNLEVDIQNRALLTLKTLGQEII
jgi:hypothetical protein